MEVAKDTCVVVEYTVRLRDGSYVKGEDGPVSLNFVVGYGQVMPALEYRLLGLADGTETDFVIPAREAFGERDQAQVRRRSFQEFPEGRSLEAGKWAIATHRGTEAQYSYFVREKDEEGVTLDFNHPLAGEDLHYHLKVVRVRPAMQDELEFIRPCGKEDENENPPSSLS